MTSPIPTAKHEPSVCREVPQTGRLPASTGMPVGETVGAQFTRAHLLYGEWLRRVQIVAAGAMGTVFTMLGISSCMQLGAPARGEPGSHVDGPEAVRLPMP